MNAIETLRQAPSLQPALALVTGASSGIGRELARLAAQDGYDLIAAVRRADRLAAHESLGVAGGRVRRLARDKSK